MPDNRTRSLLDLMVPSETQIRSILQPPQGGPARYEDLTPVQKEALYQQEMFYPGKMTGMRVNPRAWDVYLRAQRPSTNIEDRRYDDPTTGQHLASPWR